MKNLFLILIFMTPIFLFGNTHSDYIKAMNAAINDLFQAEKISEYVIVANTLERIGGAEENEWHPLYYLSLTKILMSNIAEESEDIDKYLDQAQSALDKAKAFHKSPHSEIVALQGFIHMLRIPVDAAARGPEYSGLAMMEISKSIELGPDNPRAHYIMAQMQMGTARFFGSDYTQACKSLEKSLLLFEKQSKPKHPLDPIWGHDWAMALNTKCKQSP